MKLLFATNNPNKLKEIKAALKDGFELLSLQDVGFDEDIPETTGSIEGNAVQKATYLYEKLKIDVFADDTGLEVEALNGAPGVDSAHYSGSRDSAANIQKLLNELEGKNNRKARFKTVIALVLDGETYQFTGTVEGEILQSPRGEGGFGYDPVFVPEHSNKAFGEMSMEEKNAGNHRVRALQKLITFLSGTLY